MTTLNQQAFTDAQRMELCSYVQLAREVIAQYWPMRLLAVIESPRERIRAIINRQRLLEQILDRGWVTLVALEPQDGAFYQYNCLNGWTLIQGGSHDQLNTASHERN